MTDPVPPPVNVGFLITEISGALNDLGDTTAIADPRIAPAVALLSKINSEWWSNPSQGQIDANSLAGQLNSLRASNPTNSRLADAADCAEQLAGTWGGDDYV